MRICAVMKYPPIEGGVSARAYWVARSLAARGHQVSVITNAAEVEDEYRIWMSEEDEERLEASFPNGGKVKLVQTGSFRRSLSHIPWSNPFVTKLAALATGEIRATGADILFSWYFEPYSLSGSLAASWTGVPHVVQHAGSDRTRLMSHPELSLAYHEMLRHASKVITGGPAFCGLGLDSDQLAHIAVRFQPSEWSANNQCLDVNALTERLATLGHPAITNRRFFPEGIPVVGVYGKIGETKGTFDLVSALAEVRRHGIRFVLLTLAGGREWPAFRKSIVDAHLGDITWTLPFLPHWRVPEFLRACTVVCFLERKFPVSIHTPGIPQEIFAAGTCAVLSGEIAGKQPFKKHLRNGHNVLLVDDPSDISRLSQTLEHALSDPERSRAIGQAGAQLLRVEHEDALGQAYEQIFTQTIDRHHRTSNSDVALSNPETKLSRFLETHMPASLRLLQDVMPDWLSEFYRAPVAQNGSIAIDAYKFSELMIEKSRSVSGMPECLSDLIEYEQQLLWLAVDLEGLVGLLPFPQFRRRLSTNYASMLKMRPLASNWLRCRTFRCNVTALQASILRGERYTTIPTTNMYLFQKRGDLDARIFRINALTKQLIDVSDGQKSVAVIAELLKLEDPVRIDTLCRKISELAKEFILVLL
ncbi:MAG TPA: glycosyltransferase family 4 protein [Terriglobales bacterium]